MMNTPRIKKIKYLLLSLEGLIRLLERRKVMPLVLAPSISLSLSLLTSNDALACVCSTLILIQFGWNGSFRQLSAAMAPDGFLASSAGIRD